MTQNIFICTIVFGLLESPKLTLFKDLVGKIIDARVAENDFVLLFSVTLNLIISRIKSLNKVILNDYNRPNKTVQINVLHGLYSVKVI